MTLEYGPTSAPLVLLLHGGGLGAWSWRGVMEQLASDYHLVAPTLPGHEGRPGIFLMPEAITETAERAAEGPGGQAHLVGLSLGGQLALATAAAHPELVSSLLVTGANVEGIPFFSFVGPSLKPLAPIRNWKSMQAMTMKSMGITDEVDKAAYRRSAASMDAWRLMAVMTESHQFRLPHGAAAISCPVAVLRGAKEAGAIKKSVAAVSAAIPGALSGVALQAAHPWPLQQPARFAALLRTWLTTQTLDQSVLASE